MGHQVQGMPDLGLIGHALFGAPSGLTPAEPPPSPHSRRPGSTLALVLGMKVGGGWGAYPISRWPGGPLGLAVLALLPLWTQKQL